MFFLYLFTFFTALGVSLALTPWIARTARSIGMVDRPDGALKNHEEPVAYLGGLAVFVAFLVGFSPFTNWTGRFWPSCSAGPWLFSWVFWTTWATSAPRRNFSDRPWLFSSS